MNTIEIEAPQTSLNPDADTDTGRLRILLAEDDDAMRELLTIQLHRKGYEVIQCSDGQGLVERLASLFLPGLTREHYDLVISDIRMPGFTGLEILDGLRDCGMPPVILITAFGDEATHALAARLGAVAMFDKPFRIPDLIAKVQEVIGQK